MSRRCRGVLSLLMAAALGLGLATPARSIGDLSETGSESFSDVAACTAGSSTLLTAIVVDESLSLRATDPDDRRVDAILTALDSLERLGQNTDLSVQASLAVFGERYSELVGWGTADGGHLDSLRDAATTQLPVRDSSNFTDYRQALSGAQASLAARADTVDPNACKLVLWLTDGRLDVDGTGDAPATDAAREQLCAAGGIIDGVRADGVAVVALGLMTAQGQGSVTQLDRDRLQAIAEGSGGAEQCGTVPVSADVTNGAFLTSDDAGALSRLFAQMGALLEGGSDGASFVCPGEVCIDGRLEIPVDPGVGGFRTVIEATQGAPAPQLVGPDGTTIALDSATAEAPGATISTLVGNELVTVDVRTSSEAVGTWTLVTDPRTSTVIDLYYFWGITLTVDAPDGVVIGETSTIRVVPRTASGEALDLGVLQEAQLTATVDGDPVSFVVDDQGWVAEITVPQSDAVSSLTVSGQAVAVTDPFRIALGPVSVEQTLATAFPPAFPTVSPAEIDFGRLSESTSAVETLQIAGAERGPTRACFAGADVTGPEAAGALSIDVGADCVDVPAGETVDVTVSLDAESRADGLISGSVPVELYGVDETEPIQLQIPVQAAMVRPVDATTRNWLIAVLTIAALALAWLTALVGQRLTGRYAVSNFAKLAVVPVTMTPGGLRRRDGAGSLLNNEDFGTFRGARGRRFVAGPAQFDTRYPWFPLREAQPVVRGRDGRVPVSHIARSSARPAERFTLSPSKAGFTVVTTRAADPDSDLEGDLVVLVEPPRGSGIGSAVTDRLTQIRRVNWSGEVERARAAWAAIDSADVPKTPPRGPRGAAAPSSPERRPADGDAPPPRRSDARQNGSGSEPPAPRRTGSASDAPPPPRGSGPPPPRGSTPAPRRADGGPSAAPQQPSRGRPSIPRGDEPPPPPRRR